MTSLVQRAVLALLLGAGCVATEGPDPTVELGTGELRFEPLAPMQEVELAHGAQGLWHVWMSLRAEGLDPTRAMLEIATVIDGTERTSRAPVTLKPETPDGDMLVLVGWPVVIADPEQASGKAIRIAVSLTDQEGANASDSRDILVHWTPVKATPR